MSDTPRFTVTERTHDEKCEQRDVPFGYCCCMERKYHSEAAQIRADNAALCDALRECVTETPGAACYNTGKKTRRLEAINKIVLDALKQNSGEISEKVCQCNDAKRYLWIKENYQTTVDGNYYKLWVHSLTFETEHLNAAIDAALAAHASKGAK
jgi:hypothetical protein